VRTEAEIRERFDELFERELRRKLSEYLTRTSLNCRYNSRHRVKGDGQVGFCVCPAVLTRLEKPVYVCQDDGTARRCPVYECKNTEAGVRQEFLEEIRSPSVCGQRYPKLAVLLWFMQRLPDRELPSRGARLCDLVRDVARKLRALLLSRWP
jgi:hypothetical protein